MQIEANSFLRFISVQAAPVLLPPPVNPIPVPVTPQSPPTIPVPVSVPIPVTVTPSNVATPQAPQPSGKY
jgi:hypothetical protein